MLRLAHLVRVSMAILVCVSLVARAALPPELEAVRKTHQSHVKTVSAPLVAQYKQSLELLKRTLGSRGNLQGALAVQKEMEALHAGKITPAGDGAADDPADLKSARSNFHRQLGSALNPVNTRYVQTLDALKKELGARGDIQGALAVQAELNTVTPPQRPLGMREDGKMVIWNQNNGGNGDRGTTSLNVFLLSKGNVVWKRIGVRMPWDKSKIEKEEFPVPTFGFDTARIEITGLVKNQGGLGEIEIFRAGKNIAQGGDVKVSSVWSRNNRYAGSKLTDGKPETFWLCNDKEEGWAEITLPPSK
jgi:hypothetical protein